MTDLLSSPRLPGERSPAVIDHRADWSWLPDPADVPTAPGLARARDEAERLLADHGVTYGADPEDGEHPWHLDPLPVIVDEPEWARLDAALVQRAELLDAILQDVYGHRRLLTDKLLPPDRRARSPRVRARGRRAAAARRPRAGAHRHRPGARRRGRLVRGRGPDAGAVGRRVRDGGPPRRRRRCSRGCTGRRPSSGSDRSSARCGWRCGTSPRGSAEQPRVVLLTSGPSSETAFDQAYLASMLGLPLVEGSDLLVRDGRRVDARGRRPRAGRRGAAARRRRVVRPAGPAAGLAPGRPRAGPGGARRRGQRREPAGQLGAGEPGAAHLPAAAGERGARPGPRAGVGTHLVVRRAEVAAARPHAPRAAGASCRPSAAPTSARSSAGP